MSGQKKYFFQISIICFLALSALLIYFELSYDPGRILSEDELSQEIEASLTQAQQVFDQNYSAFKEKSDELYQELLSISMADQNRSIVHSRLQEYSFWGAVILKNNQRWLWDGFNLSASPTLTNGTGDSLQVTLLKRNNVVYLFGQRSFTINEVNYQLLTAEKLEQSTNLPFEERVSYNLSDSDELRNHFPVTFNFFSPTPVNTEYKKLSTELSDSVGTVYANPADLYRFQQKISESIQEWHSYVHILFVLAAIMLFISFCIFSESRYLLQFLILVPIAVWFSFYQFEGLADWILPDYLINILNADNYPLLVDYSLHSIFSILVFAPLVRYILLYPVNTKEDSHLKTLLFASLFGALSAGLIYFFFLLTESVLIGSSLDFMDLELAPDISVFIFYIVSALLFTGISGIIISAGLYLYRFEKDKSILIGAASLFSFLLFAFLINLLFQLQFILSAVFFSGLFTYFILLLIIHVIHEKSHFFTEMSGFRKVLLSSLLITISIYFLIWISSSQSLDRQLREKATEFNNEEVTNTQELLNTLLAKLESSLIFVSEEDVQERTAILQGQFQRAIQNSIEPQWRDHSFEIKLLNTNGDLISDYSTNLDSPGWRSLVDMTLMRTSYQGERLRRVTNRPIIWDDRPSDLGQEFVSFYRGWIPIYDEIQTNQIIAWIFAAAYLERPDYNRPMRAVLSADAEQDWKQSFYIAEYINEKVNRTSMEGIYKNQPQYNRLPDREAEISARDSIAFITNVTPQGIFREIVTLEDNNRVIKASTPLPGFNHHLFSFFRYLIVLTFFGLFIFAIFSTVGFKTYRLFGQSRKFKDRLLDGLILSTILFLTVLIFVTQHAISLQNEENVERELITKLNSLGESLRGEVQLESSERRLAEFAYPLNVDAILYSQSNLIDSTTPQIFQQYVMPRTMPYDVFDFLYNRERRHYTSTTQVAGENLLIGYRTLFNEDNEIAGAVAIPTFVESPVYREQLLEATSSLFVIYLAIFALFIIGTLIFSNQLTKPLQIIQGGLNRISRGDMNTRVAVAGKDEIGTLAKAYNEMVEKLEDARKELVEAEREAAWKEMAQQVAHEIKNPLTPMKLNLQHLQQRLEANPENVLELKPMIEKTAENIIEQIESLNKIASDFSKFAKPVQEPFEPVDLYKLLTSISELYIHDENVAINTTLPEYNLTINGVEGELRRVFINLVKNGIEAHSNGKAEIKIAAERKNKSIIIQISDSGEGIDIQDRDKIFVPNFSTKSSGTGLGLAISKKIVEAHMGKVTFKSEPGNGTTFTLTFPAI